MNALQKSIAANLAKIDASTLAKIETVLTFLVAHNKPAPRASKHVVSKSDADHTVARICGVKEGDSKVDAARKVIEAMKAAGMPTRSAERMLKAAIANGA